MERTVEYSRTRQAQLLMYEHLNHQSRLFGGRIMEWIDIVAGVVARRHSGRNVTTACIDQLDFLGPAYLGDIIELDGRITYAGRTSMEVRVDAWVESAGGEKKLINRAYLVMVALDENDRPVTVPELKLETDEERAEWEAAVRRREARKHKRE